MEFFDRPPVPVAGFSVSVRPTGSAKGKKAYQGALAKAACEVFPTPITAPDVELEVYYVTAVPSEALDVDNVGKPTLDALKGVVYVDDRQVRAVRILKLDKTAPHHVSGRIGPVRAIYLYLAEHPHAVWIWVYSASESRKRRLKAPPGWERHVLLAPSEGTEACRRVAVCVKRGDRRRQGASSRPSSGPRG